LTSEESALSARTLLSRTRDANPLPEGTVAVGVGLLVAGFTAYGFLVVSARALGKEAYAPLAVLWNILFLVGPGVFLPLEQEVARALASRRARSLGGGPVVRKAAFLGGAMAAALVLVVIVTSQLLLDHLFDGEVLLVIGLAIGLIGYYLEHLTRGTLSGNGRFRPYSILLGTEGAFRFVMCVLLAAVGAAVAGPYGLALGVAPLVAVAVALRGQHHLVEPGPDASWSELSTALGALLAGSVLAQALVFGGPLAVRLLATDTQSAEVGRFTNGLIIARVPLFLFQAIQAALLPKLSALASAGRFSEFRRGFKRLLAVVAGVGALGTVVAFLIGPEIVTFMFGEEFDLGHRTLGLLAASSAIYMVAIAMAQAVIALGGHTRMALSWLAGFVTFLVVTALGNELFLRVEIGLIAGCSVAAIAMATVGVHLIRSGASLHSDDLIEAIHDLPVEP
jgi:O-antigen/teichoic acid export membrane protein